MANNMNITEVRLLYVPLENDYKHTFYFANAAAQESYFKGRSAFTDVDFSYQRKDGYIRYHRDYDELIAKGVNYVMYRNTAKSSKWYYAFITKIEYVSDGKTNIYIETDVLQTWLFDYEVLPSFIEREHTNNDAVGANTVPENLETGEYIVNSNGINTVDDRLAAMDQEKMIIIAVSEDSSGNPVTGKYYGGAYSGLKYIPCATVATAENIINSYDTGKADAIQCIFMAPSMLVSIDAGTGEIKNSELPVTYTSSSSNTPTAIDGYTPKNKKLLCYPYSYLYVTNNQGAGAIYHNEKFYGTEWGAAGVRKFTTFGVLCPGCSVRVVPYNYNNMQLNNDEGLNLGKYPVCNWTSDVYTNWLTQNGVNIALQVGSGLAAIAGGAMMALTGAGAGIGMGGIAGGAMSIANAVSQIIQHDMIPPQAHGNTNCGDVMFSMKSNTFTYTDMCIKAEYARIIDEYFNMYGYKSNRVKRPFTAHRAEYWYIKTIDVNIDGMIPMEDMRKIKECYNNGLTFWKTPANIQNYSVNNPIV